MAKKSLIEWIESPPREVLYTLLLIILSIPLIKPLGLPIPVSARTIEFHHYIETLPDGAYVMVSLGYGVSSQPAFEPFVVATFHDLFKRNVKVVVETTGSDGPIVYKSAIAKANPDSYGKKYGEDYVFLGYVPGGETAMKALAEDIHAAVPADYYGTPIEQIQMLKNIHGATDFTLVICFTSAGDTAVGWIRQWVTSYNVPYLSCVLTMMMPTLEPYYPVQVKALVGADKGGEMEFLVGHPGPGLQKADSFSLSHIVLMAIIIVANIAYFSLKAQKKEV
ncbi:MAG: hypothetical protein NDF53_02600 [archaeon GB-1867-097]|nr:hypothetical protein [Candidatus Culexmicrobium thermophilum]